MMYSMNKEKFMPEGAIFDMGGLRLDTEKPMIPCYIKAGKYIYFDPYGSTLDSQVDMLSCNTFLCVYILG